MTEFGVRGLRVDHVGLIPGELLPPEDPTDRGPVKRTARDWLVDCLFFAFALGLGLGSLSSSLSSSTQHVSHLVTWIDVLLGLLSCVLLWWRRRWPVALGLVMVPIGAISAFSVVAVLIILFTVAVHRRTAIALAVGLANLLSGLLFNVFRPQSEPMWVVLLFSVIFLAALIAWGMFVRARRQLVWSLRERAERAEAEQRLMADQARAAERTRIAREMHDVLAHRVSLVALQAGALEVRPDLPAEEVRAAAALIRNTAREALEELRGVIGVLRDTSDTADRSEVKPEAPQPTLDDIGRLVEQSRSAGAKVQLEFDVPDTAAVPVGVGRDAYRIVQEALTNVNKHARGTITTVQVSGTPKDGLLVRVRNRLPVGSTSSSNLPGSGVGLIGLRERLDLAGGTLTHGPDGAGAFVVEARLPWTR